MDVYEFKQCYANLPVLVTGATRYVGAELVRKLVSLGARPHVLTRSTSSTSLLSSLGDEISILPFDGKIETMREIIRRSEPQVVFHLASSGEKHDSLEVIDTVLDANIKLGTQLVQAMAEMNYRRFVTTGSFWQHRDGAGFDPVNLYAATKAAFETIAEYYAIAHGIRTTCLELFDVYGPYDPRNKLLPFLCNAAKTGEKLELTAGRQLLNLVHVSDITSGYLLAGARLLESQSTHAYEKFALAAESSVTLREFLALFQQLLGRELSLEWGVKPYRDRAVLEPWIERPPLPGWRPAISLHEGIKEILRTEELA